MRGVNILGAIFGYMPTLGTIISTFGPPTCVVPLQLRNAQRFLTSHYNTPEHLTYLSIPLDSTWINWLQAVYAVTLLSPNERSRPCELYGHGSPWRGLRSYDTYSWAGSLVGQ